MAEFFFIATVIFVAYVVYVVIDEKKEASAPNKSVVDKAPHSAATENVAPTSTLVKSAAKSPVRNKAAQVKPNAVNPDTETAAIANTDAAIAVDDSLKNPKTGEIAKIPNTYTFAKRWIKEALVEEGLLDRIYKNNELDEATNAKIQQALQQLKALEKYR